MSKKAVKAKKIPARPAESLGDRLHHCAAMLYIHGLLTDGERVKVFIRMVKRKKARERDEAGR